MKRDKTKLLQDIEAMKEKLASMEEEVNKAEESRHFPSEGEKYYYFTSTGEIWSSTASNNDLRVNAFRTREEGQEAYNKAVALEKIKRRIIELQGDWKPDWTDKEEAKCCIHYDSYNGWFNPDCWFRTQYDTSIPYMKNIEIVKTIIKELEDELKLIFDIH